MQTTNGESKFPPGIAARISAYKRRRILYSVCAGFFLAVCAAALIVLVAFGSDRLAMLPSGWRQTLRWAMCAPGLLWLLWAVGFLVVYRVGPEEMRHLDSQFDDVRAALDLSGRLDDGEERLRPDLVAESIERAAGFADRPLPAATQPRRRLIVVIVICVVAGLLLYMFTRVAPDMHTALSRFLEVEEDFGSIGLTKFDLYAETWEHPAAIRATAEGPTREPGTAKRGHDEREALRRTYFLRESWTGTEWSRNFQEIRRTFADRLFGYNPLALQNRHIHVLAGDALKVQFKAIDATTCQIATDGLEAYRHIEDRALKLKFSKLPDRCFFSLDRVTQTHRFQIVQGDQFSPNYEVNVVQRPTPTVMHLVRHTPSQYGKSTDDILLKDAQRDVDMRRLSGLPGSRMEIEFRTPYGADLDRKASFVQIGTDRRVKLRYASSRNSERRAQGGKYWRFEFTLDDSLGKDPKLSFHLITQEATFNGAPITNKYDEPYAIKILEDRPPTAEFTLLPTERHFEADDAFIFQYRYNDDYGVSEIGLEIQPPEGHHGGVFYQPLEVRPPDKPGALRKADEVTEMIALAKYRWHTFAFSVVVKDVSGQEAKTSQVSLTLSRSPIEKLLPKLTGGWHFAWSHAPDNWMFRPGDLEILRSLKGARPYRAALEQLLTLLAGREVFDTKRIEQLLKALKYSYHLELNTGGQPFGFRHRDYPFYFQKQGAAVICGVAGVSTTQTLSEIPTLLVSLRDKLAATARKWQHAGRKPEEQAKLREQWIAELKAAPEHAALIRYEQHLNDQIARLDLVIGSHDEVQTRATLLRAAYFGETLRRRIGEASALLASLEERAGAADLRPGVDPWQAYPGMVIATQKDYNVKQQARLVRYKIAMIQRKLEHMQKELERVLERPAGLDTRLLALISLVRSFGRSIYNIDRQELAAKCEVLARFVRRGIFGAETDVYRELVKEFPTAAAQAELAAKALPQAVKLTAAVQALKKACAEILEADLASNLGDPKLPASASEALLRNRRSRMRSVIEATNKRAREALYGDLYAKITSPIELRQHVTAFEAEAKELQKWLPEWPQLQAQEPVIKRLRDALRTLDQILASYVELEKAIAMLSGFAEVFAEGGLPEVTDRKLVEDTYARFLKIREYGGLRRTLLDNANRIRTLGEQLDRQSRIRARNQERLDAARATLQQKQQALEAATAKLKDAQARLEAEKDEERRKELKKEGEPLSRARAQAEAATRSASKPVKRYEETGRQREAEIQELSAEKEDIEAKEKDYVAALAALLPEASKACQAIRSLPVWQQPVQRVLATQPHSAISDTSSTLFDYLAPRQVLARLAVDEKRFADQPELVDRLYDAAIDHFLGAACQAAKERLASPAQEYLRSRLAAALIGTSRKWMGEFARTYTKIDPQDRAYLDRYFAQYLKSQHVTEKEKQAVRQWLASRQYPLPTVPPPLAALAQPYLQAQRQGRLPAFLRQQRAAKLQELRALVARIDPLIPNEEAFLRVSSLRDHLRALREDARLMHYRLDDIRLLSDWVEVQEEAEGLDRDLLAGRLAAIPATAALALRQKLYVLRRASFAEVATDEALMADFLAYQRGIEALTTKLAGHALRAAEALRADTAKLRHDLAIALLGTYGPQYWWKHQLAGDLARCKAALHGLVGKARIGYTKKPGLTSTRYMPQAATMRAMMLLVWHGHRAACLFDAAQFAAHPSPERRHALGHDYARVILSRHLAEHYYDVFISYNYQRQSGYFSGAADGAVEDMQRKFRTCQDAVTELSAYLLGPEREGRPVDNRPLMSRLGDFYLDETLVNLDKDFAFYEASRAAIVEGEPSAKMNRALARIVRSPKSRGRFWRGLGNRLADFLAKAERVADPAAVSAMAPSQLRTELDQLVRAAEDAQRYVESLGGALTKVQRNELAVVEEALSLLRDWAGSALDDRTENSRRQATFMEIRDDSQSCLEGLHGNIFPPVQEYPERLRYAKMRLDFSHWNFIADILETERSWFIRADGAFAVVTQRFLEHAYEKKLSRAADSLPPAIAFVRFLDTKFRYLMAHLPSIQTGGRTPPPPMRIIDETMPEHLGVAFSRALNIDLPNQGNVFLRKLYFRALQEGRAGE